MWLYEGQNLPVRPLRHRGESVAGYVYRLCDANGHSVPDPIRSSLTTLYGKSGREDKSRAATKISKLTGAIAESDWPRWQDPHGWLKQSSRWMRTCSMCLSEQGFHKALWELPLVHACPYHRIKLQDRCDCGKALTWRGLKADWRCKCGASLKQLGTEDADQGLLALSRVVSTCEQTGEESNWDVDPLMAELSLAELYARAEFLHKLDARFILSQNARTKLSRFPGASTGRFFSNWKDSVQEYIERWIDSLFQKSDDSPIVVLPLQSAVARLVQFLEESTDGSSTAHKDVLEAVRCHVVPTQWPATVLLRGTVDRELLRAWLESFFKLTDRVLHSCAAGFPKAARAADRKTEHQRKELRLLLHRMISSLLRGDLPADYRRAAAAWPPLTDFTGGSGEEWLAHIIEPLCGASLNHLRYLTECFDQPSAGE